MRKRRGLVPAMILGLAAGVVALCAAPGRAGLQLDIAADWAPLLCGDTVYIFSSGGRNQIMAPRDSAPNCDPVQMSPALQPQCGGGDAWVLDKGGTLWQLGHGIPVQIASNLKGAVAVVPWSPSPAVFFAREVLLPDGVRRRLDITVAHAQALGGDGFWVRGTKEAARLDASGSVLWTWAPRRGSPGPATLAGSTVFTATSEGDLVALKADSGRVRFAYRGGGQVTSPPVVVGDDVIYASTDHFIRAITTRSGQLVWQFRAEGRPSFGPFKVEAGILFAESAGSRLVILDEKDGHPGWTWTVPKGSILKCPAVSATEAVVLAWTDDPKPWLYRIDLPSALPKEKTSELRRHEGNKRLKP